MPARWDNTSIVVADAVVISKPYLVDNCRPLIAGDVAALARVRKVVRIRPVPSLNKSMLIMCSKQLEMERKKIELRNASAAIGNSNNFPRNAGAARGAPNKDARNSVAGAAGGPGAAGQRKGG